MKIMLGICLAGAMAFTLAGCSGKLDLSKREEEAFCGKVNYSAKDNSRACSCIIKATEKVMGGKAKDFAEAMIDGEMGEDVPKKLRSLTMGQVGDLNKQAKKCVKKDDD
jgi:hypothetical protein